MAAGSSEILRQYLVSLGYKVDIGSFNKFQDNLGKTGKNIFKVGAAVAAVVGTIQASTMAFAYNMRRMYFSSELANSSAKNLNNMAYASEQIGISGDEMKSAITGMARAIRLNPGAQAFIESLGVKVSGRDSSDVLKDTVKELGKMPEFQAAAIARDIFGLDPDTYHMMVTHLDEFTRKEEEARKIWADYGLDLDKNKEMLKKYAGETDKISEKFEALGALILTDFSGPMSTVIESTNQWMDSLARFFKDPETKKMVNEVFEGAVNNMTDLMEKVAGWYEKIKGGTTDVMEMIGDSVKQDVDNYHAIVGKTTDLMESTVNAYKESKKKHEEVSQGFSERASNLVSRLKSKFGFTDEQAAGIAGNLAHESAGLVPGKQEMKPIAGRGGLGYAQWTGPRRREFEQFAAERGLSTGSEEANIAFLEHELSGKYKGAVSAVKGTSTVGEAVRAFEHTYERAGVKNYGSREDYANRIYGMDTARLGSGGKGGVNMNQNTTINVTGSNAQDIGKAVAREQNRVNGDMLRNLKSPIV